MAVHAPGAHLSFLQGIHKNSSWGSHARRVSGEPGALWTAVAEGEGVTPLFGRARLRQVKLHHEPMNPETFNAQHSTFNNPRRRGCCHSMFGVEC